MENDILLEVKNLCTYFSTEKGKLRAVDHISFSVKEKEIVGIVGESGCGKSVTAESIMRLLDEKNLVSYEGEILYKGNNLLSLKKNEMQEVRGKEIAMIFQDPMTSLNPVYTIGNQIVEGILTHQKISKKEAKQKAIDLLRFTEIPSPEKRFDQYPHELSGGMRQRVMIALALACNPKLLIADEPTTALDVTTQSQILDLLNKLKDELNMSTIMITHDLGVVAELCSRVIVMYLGQIIEIANVEDIFDSAQHPYTEGLLNSIPHIDGDRSKKLNVIQGTVPTLDKVPVGCNFAGRCQYATDKCREVEPELKEVMDNHFVKCWNYELIRKTNKEENEIATPY
ncbi:ABC transporter ATP-binding protein [Ureibacillus manganicus]|uniref:Peptide ABC transporter ATP-binding protein n=1 Tax=Ureibacillus manganicus DSM 26584 TaxID=1384049 RepID=A0A0A3I3I4_9BACL|nr:ABC transporter ATP-binding protein [Ureibacillus manganicus]KGR78070.1 peptide ABC transporter ATP-binding protein [Ureibacillus manganicus DSM 26584]